MTTTIRAIYANGVLTPLDPHDLKEGCPVSLDVTELPMPLPSAETSVPESEPELPYPDYVRFILAEQATWPSEELEGPPTDFARNKKHYLYGHLKEEDE